MDRYRECLPPGNAGYLPVEVISTKALVPSITRECDGYVLPHQPTHRIDSKEGGVSKGLPRMQEQACDVLPGPWHIVHVQVS
jgi:hypothetical protein